MTIDSTLRVISEMPLPDAPEIPNPIPLVFGTYYTFQRAGVVLAEHAHTDDNMHFTIVVAGGFTATVAGVDRTIVAGDIIDLGKEPHSFTATADNSVLINVRKVGVSAESIDALKLKANATIDGIVAKLSALKA